MEVMQVLERIRLLAKEGNWSEVLNLAPNALASATGDDAARLHLHMASAHAGLGEWKLAISHTEQALSLSECGTYTHTWATQKLASLYVETGRMQESIPYAYDYLKNVKNHPSLSVLTPYVVRGISHVFYRQGKFALSATWRLRALQLFEELGNDAEVTRTRINLAWTYARAGNTGKAKSYLPTEVPSCMVHLLNGAKCVIASKERRWQDAQNYGTLALRGARLVHDYVDAAEVSLLVASAQRALGNCNDIPAYIRLAALFASRQDQSASALMVLTLREKGGDNRYEATAFCGSGGYHPDACFTTSVG
jgi:tetratricopeptide (TPR) repeat protein